MPEDHGIGPREPPAESLQATDATAGVMYKAQAHAAELQLERRGQIGLHAWLVNVAVDRRDGPVGAQLLECAEGGQVPRVDDQVSPTQALDARRRQCPRAAGQVRVGDDGGSHFGAGGRPSGWLPSNR